MRAKGWAESHQEGSPGEREDAHQKEVALPSSPSTAEQSMWDGVFFTYTFHSAPSTAISVPALLHCQVAFTHV